MSPQGAGLAQGTALVEDRGVSVALLALEQMPSRKRYKGGGAGRALLQCALLNEMAYWMQFSVYFNQDGDWREYEIQNEKELMLLKG